MCVCVPMASVQQSRLLPHVRKGIFVLINSHNYQWLFIQLYFPQIHQQIFIDFTYHKYKYINERKYKEKYKYGI